jgi:hypothetical protein
MALDTLLTFCPPAPWARMALNSISLSGMSGARMMSILVQGSMLCEVPDGPLNAAVLA